MRTAYVFDLPPFFPKFITRPKRTSSLEEMSDPLIRSSLDATKKAWSSQLRTLCSSRSARLLDDAVARHAVGPRPERRFLRPAVTFLFSSSSMNDESKKEITPG